MAAEDETRHTTVIAFYSYTSGVGRSCAVANVALILASQGYRVLVADLDLPSPSLHRYLAAFLPETTTTTAAVRLTCEFLSPDGGVDFRGPMTDVVTNPQDFAVQREDLTQLGYDYVLIDAPAGVTADADAVIKELADVLIVGYGLSKQAMDGAAQRAKAVQESHRGRMIRMLPVAMRVDRDGGPSTNRALAEGRRQFAWLLSQMTDEDRRRYWGTIEIPYESDYAAEESLAFLDDSSAQRDRLLESYLQLSYLLAPDAVPPPPASVTDQTRARYRTWRSAAGGSNALVHVLHAGADRYWAEWLASALQRLGLRASMQRIDQIDPAAMDAGNSAMLVVSKSLLALAGANDYLTAIANDMTLGGQVPLAVSIDDSELPSGQFPMIGYVKLAGRSELLAWQELASFYDLLPGKNPGARGPVYYAGGTENRWNLPARPSIFRGRDDDIDRIRDHFMSEASQNILTLTGRAGIGKSQLAVEYAYRFAAGYDLVHFIRADSIQTTRAGVAELAEVIQPARRGDAPTAALRQLQSELGERPRWLLIYDGADVPANLADLLPDPGHGHVLITARTTPVDSSAQLPIESLDPLNASTMLMELVPGLLPADARRLATDLQEIPLALNLAAAWIRAVAQQLLAAGLSPGTIISNAVTELHEQLADAIHDSDAAMGRTPGPLESMIKLLVERLTDAEHGSAAVYLLEACAFLAPIGMSQQLLRSPEMLRQLTTVDSDISDPVVLNNVLHALVTHGLSQPGETPRAPVQVHPLILDLLKSQLTPEKHAARSAAVARVLAASAPVDIDEDTLGHAKVYAELQQHLEPSGAWRITDFPVRRWLVSQIRFLWQAETVGAWATAVDLGERLAQYWSVELPDGEDDPLLLRLQTQLANVYRSRCDFDRARALDRAVVERQRRTLGLKHLRTLNTARGYAADLRLLGDVRGAQAEDQSTWQAFSQTLGDDHLMTIVASSNLALSELMTGEPEQALQRQRADLERCKRILFERPTQPAWIRFHIGTLLRELGLYEESYKYLRSAQHEFELLVRQEAINPTVWVVLRTKAGLAITDRRLGNPSLKLTDEALAVCRDTYGDRYPDVLALFLSRAGALHAEGHHQEAVEQAEQALEGYASVFGPAHPFTRLCQVDLSIYALSAGQIAVAEEMSRIGWSSLEEDLTRRHLWSLAASVARANVLAVTGNYEQARALEDRTLVEYRRRLGPSARFTQAVERNAAHTRQLLSGPDVAAASAEAISERQVIELDTPPY